MVQRAATLPLCVMFSLLLAACGGSSAHSTKTRRASPAQTSIRSASPAQTSTRSVSPAPMSTRAQPPDAGGLRAALTALQVAIRNRDVDVTCRSLLPGTATRARGSTQAIDAAIAAVVRDCEAGFGQRGEFAAYAPLTTATVRRIDIRGRLATIAVDSSRGPASLRFLYLRGAWWMLVTGS